jgi:hypothetical protein
MIKLILFITITLILIVITFKYQDNEDQNLHLPKITSSKIVKSNNKNRDVFTEEQTLDLNKTNKKIAKIKLLLEKTKELVEKNKNQDALLIYDHILEIISTTDDPLFDEYFVTACMSQAYIYQLYPNTDKDASIEAYNQIIKKFEESNDKKSIQYYIDAKIQLSYLLSEDEKLEIYNELVSKFKNHQNREIQKRIETLLINKSFELMGKNDEEALQILDEVIEKYQENNATVNLPENIQISILNRIELALITNNENDEYIEVAKKFMSNLADTKPLLDMLEIIKNAQEVEQEEALNKWKEEHANYYFPDWSFQEVERWAYKIEDKETKDRVTKYINAFVNQKYNNSSINNEEIIENSDEATNENTYEEESTHIGDNNSLEYIYSNEYENSNETPYEADPYIQEIYEATGEYPDPYEYNR